MTANNLSNSVSIADAKQVSLEEIDLLARKYHHLHDEEIAKAVSRFFGRFSELFGSHHVDGQHHPAH